MNTRPTFSLDPNRRPLSRGDDIPARPLSEPRRTLASTDLFHGLHEIGIEHHGALYRLKITRQGKLILNK